MNSRSRWVGTLGIVWVALAAGTLRADDDPQKTLTDKGLKKFDTTFVLPDESQVDAKLQAAQKIRTAKVAPAQRQVFQLEKAIEGLNQQMERGKKFMDAIEIELPKIASVTKHNEMVSQFNAALKQVEALDKQIDQQKKLLKDKRATAVQAAESYSESLIEVRKHYDKVAQRYKELVADKTVTDALAALNKTDAKRKFWLGPSTSFISLGKRMKTLEEQVFSESVPIRRTEGDLWVVAVTVGDKTAVEMEVDTGSSSMALPSEVAKTLGLEPPADAPTIVCQLATGQLAKGKLVVAKRVRVGRFEVNDVECIVFGPEYPEASVLLGQAFLGHFAYKIDAEKSRMTMTRLEKGPVKNKKDDK